MEWKTYVRNGPAAADGSLRSRALATCLWHRAWLYLGFVAASVTVAWLAPVLAPWFWGYCVGVVTAVVGARLFNVESLTLGSKET
jgi:hypothetical protein